MASAEGAEGSRSEFAYQGSIMLENYPCKWTFVLSLFVITPTLHAQTAWLGVDVNKAVPFLDAGFLSADIIADSEKVESDSPRDVKAEAIANAMGEYYAITGLLTMAGLPSPPIMSMSAKTLTWL